MISINRRKKLKHLWIEWRKFKEKKLSESQYFLIINN